MNATVTCRMMGPDGVSYCSRIGQRLFMFLMKCLDEYLGKTTFKRNPGKYLVNILGRIEVSDNLTPPSAPLKSGLRRSGNDIWHR